MTARKFKGSVANPDGAMTVIDAVGTPANLAPKHLPAVNLGTIDSVRLEAARCYRAMKAGSIRPEDGTRLIYALSTISKMIEVSLIERRLAALEALVREGSQQ